MPPLEFNPGIKSAIELLKKRKSKKEQFQELKSKFDSEKEDEEFSEKLKEMKKQRQEFKINKIKSFVGLKR